MFDVPLYSISLKTFRYLVEEDNVAIADLHDLSNFTLSICFPYKEINFSGCEWFSISEGFENKALVVENIKIVATKRWVVYD